MPFTWTHLDQTAESGTDILHLKDSVTWNVDDEIVIATTGIYGVYSDYFRAMDYSYLCFCVCDF